MATVPTILTIPSAYKDGYYGIVYNVLPQNNSKVLFYQQSGNATRVNKNGVIETNGSNLPRLDYTNSTCPSLLLEPQRTNSIDYSESLSTWIPNGASAIDSQETSPDGSVNASKVTSTANLWRIANVINQPSGISITFSAYAKLDPLSTSKGVILESSRGAGGTVYAFFNLETETITSNLYTNAFIKNIGNGWYRVGGTYTTNGTAQVNYLYPNNVYGVAGSAFIWGAQAEVGIYASSYIKTIGFSSTRNIESCFSPTLTNEMNGSKSSFFIDVLAFKETSTISLTTGNTTGISINFDPDVNQIVIYGSGLLYFIPVDYSQRIKIGISFENNNFKIYYNGVLSAIDTSVTYPTTLNTIKFSEPTNGLKFQGNLYDLRFYNNVILTQAELIELTTI